MGRSDGGVSWQWKLKRSSLVKQKSKFSSHSWFLSLFSFDLPFLTLSILSPGSSTVNLKQTFVFTVALIYVTLPKCLLYPVWLLLVLKQRRWWPRWNSSYCCWHSGECSILASATNENESPPWQNDGGCQYKKNHQQRPHARNLAVASEYNIEWLRWIVSASSCDVLRPDMLLGCHQKHFSSLLL